MIALGLGWSPNQRPLSPSSQRLLIRDEFHLRQEFYLLCNTGFIFQVLSV